MVITINVHGIVSLGLLFIDAIYLRLMRIFMPWHRSWLFYSFRY